MKLGRGRIRVDVSMVTLSAWEELLSVGGDEMMTADSRRKVTRVCSGSSRGEGGIVRNRSPHLLG